MSRLRFLLSLVLSAFTIALHAEENFLLVNGNTNETIWQLGSHLDERITPCSTFKIALSLMGYDAEILRDESTPSWLFQEGYDDFLASWKEPQTPKTWMKTSCVWFSRVLATQLGEKKMQLYLDSFHYGNQDTSGGLTQAWINSSLKISPKEQVLFIRSMTQGKLPVSKHALEMTKAILYLEMLPEGWKLFGKTGWSGKIKDQDGYPIQIGWFVGWIEKDNASFPFAYNIIEENLDLKARIPRVKQLIMESQITK